MAVSNPFFNFLFLYGTAFVLVKTRDIPFFKSDRMQIIHQGLEILFIIGCLVGLTLTVISLQHPWYFILSALPIVMIFLFNRRKRND